MNRKYQCGVPTCANMATTTRVIGLNILHFCTQCFIMEYLDAYKSAGPATIARAANLPTKTIQKALQELIEERDVEKHRNQYRLMETG